MLRADLARLKAAAFAAVTLALAATPALAQWRDGGRGDGRREAAYQNRGDRSGDRVGGWRSRGGDGRDAGGEGPRRADRGYGGQGYGGQGYGGGRGFAGYGASAYPPRRGADGYGGVYPQPSPAAGGRAWRRGEVLPDGYRGASVADPGRYHLRRPPNGYDWVGDNRNAYLMQRSTGLVLDSVPGAYEAPPPYRGRRR